MTDRELLELAAKAAGIEVWPGIGVQSHMLFTRSAKSGYDGRVTGVEWNPLTDDGDALRLAVALRMKIDHNHPSDETPWVSVRAHPMRMCAVEDFEDECQRTAATRHAIVRTAAAIGETMQ